MLKSEVAKKLFAFYPSPVRLTLKADRRLLNAGLFQFGTVLA